MLDPRRTAEELVNLCATVPGFEWGAIGAHNALRLAGTALTNAGTASFGFKLAFFALADHPLDSELIKLCAALGRNNAPPLARFAQALLKFCATSDKTLPSLSGNDFTELRKEIVPELRGESAIFRLGQTFEWCVNHDPDGECLEEVMRIMPPLLEEDADQTLRARLRAGFALARREPDEALRLLDSAPMPGFENWLNLRRADCLARLERLNEAAGLLWPLWQSMPTHPNLILALHNLHFGAPLRELPKEMPLPPILLYSWNKRDILADTLRSLLNTEAAGAPVFVLDNGSTDGTADMLQNMAENFQGGMRIISLPVNIGAPPARNWLLALPELRAFERVVFLDDDLVLPKGWLAALLAVARANPSAGNIGCAITDHTPPYAVQAADFFSLPPQMGQRSFVDLEEKFLIHCAAAGGRENLLLRHVRPCLSVSGCCHMIKMDALKSCGAFDIRFNPSQFDDLERDLRLALRKIPVMYTGNFPVRHVQHSSLKQAVSRARSAHIFGNKIKLEFLYSEGQAREMREFTQSMARQDLLRKCTQLAGTNPNL